MDCSPLVNALVSIPCNWIKKEILILDDGSDAIFSRKYQALTAEEEVKHLRSEHNQGRSGIRNWGAQQANSDWLLFIDADSAIVYPNYLCRYKDAIANGSAAIVAGGTSYQKHAPDSAQMLRWIYGKHREEMPAAERQKFPYDKLALNNLLVSKETFNSLGGIAKMPNPYGHEDTLFGLTAKTAETSILHIDNPVMHLGLDDTATFVSKTMEAVKNLHHLMKSGHPIKSRLSESYQKYQWLKHVPLAPWVIKQFALAMIKKQDTALRGLDLLKLATLLKL